MDIVIEGSRLTVIGPKPPLEYFADIILTDGPRVSIVFFRECVVCRKFWPPAFFSWWRVKLYRVLALRCKACCECGPEMAREIHDELGVWCESVPDWWKQ